MIQEKLDQLKEILSIPTYFGEEEIIMDYLMKYGKDMNYDVSKDEKGNVYYTKGNLSSNEFYPCVCAHTDTVFNEHSKLIKENRRKTIKQNGTILTAIHPDTGKKTGIGGDDLAGVFICLQMMENFDTIKAAFFVEEEFGCKGSSNCDMNFFSDVGYVIQFDGPTNNWYTKTLSGIKMFSDDFDNKVKPILEKYSVDNYSDDPYTDILPLKEKFDFCCANLPTGYHNWHSDDEYVNIDHVDQGIQIGIEFINKLGLEKHIYNYEDKYNFNDLVDFNDDFDDEIELEFICEKCGDELVVNIEESTIDCPSCGWFKEIDMEWLEK